MRCNGVRNNNNIIEKLENSLTNRLSLNLSEVYTKYSLSLAPLMSISQSAVSR